jgi:ABC-type multidrug transport system fused ATPase/permease subunit
VARANQPLFRFCSKFLHDVFKLSSLNSRRFYDIESGSVLIDGHEIKDLNLNWLRSVIGVVQQEPAIFADSVSENVRLGNPDLSEGDLQKICRVANAHGFIMDLPQGYSTRIGDGGIQLSGGQKVN